MSLCGVRCEMIEMIVADPQGILTTTILTSCSKSHAMRKCPVTVVKQFNPYLSISLYYMICLYILFLFLFFNPYHFAIETNCLILQLAIALQQLLGPVSPPPAVPSLVAMADTTALLEEPAALVALQKGGWWFTSPAETTMVSLSLIVGGGKRGRQWVKQWVK